MLWGVHNLEDAARARVLEVGEQQVIDNITFRANLHDQELRALIQLFAFVTTDQTLGTKSASGGELQPLGEFGRARPSRGGLAKTVGFPIFRAGDAVAFSYEARIKMTVQYVEDRMNEIFMRDARTVRRWLLSALFTPAPYDYPDFDARGNPMTLRVYGLANGTDGGLAAGERFTYGFSDGGDMEDTHYHAQAEPVAELTNPYPRIYEAITHHDANAGGEVVCFIHADQEAATRALEGFVKAQDSAVSGGDGLILTGALGVNVPGRIIGKMDNGPWIVVWSSIPSGYIVGVSTSPNKPLAMREHPEDVLRGFKVDAEREDFPYFERQMVRRAGFGGYSRIGAFVQRVGNGTYAAPAQYTAPTV